MDFKKIKNKEHYIYDNIDEFNVYNPETPVRHNWRHGDEGEWVFTDDGYVCKILRKLVIVDNAKKEVTCVRTLCGTFVAENTQREMLGEDGIADNIYTFSGNRKTPRDYDKRGRTSRELLFARYVAGGIGVTEAYKTAYPDSNSDRYIKHRTESLLKTETIRKMIDTELLALLEKKGETPEKIIDRYTSVADGAKKDSDKLGAIRDLAKMAGLFDKDSKKSEQVTIWAGFSPEQLEEVKKHGKPELIAHAKKDEEEETT
jgi:hypothetical protein|tara:strand:+ start:117 stop:893 length:777 start_codon:yes stop_codon:yes gene_type:complete